MTESKAILVPVFLASQALFVYWAGTVERPPDKPDLSHFPAQVGPWERSNDIPVDASTQAQLGADRLMNANYMHQTTGEFANVFVAWFQSQRSGTSQPHSPQVCLPASGWVPEANGLVDLETSAGKITANKYVIVRGSERMIVLYWYQTPRRVVAGEWAAKFWLMSDALRDRRTDTSIVRITTWARGSDISGATKAAADFSKHLYPLLRETFPR